MTLSQTPDSHPAPLFPHHDGSLAQSDPELVALLDRWLVDEVPAEPGPDIRTRLMLQLAASVACQGVAGYRALLVGALEAGVTPVEAKEIVYQAVPYLGIARVLDVIHATHSVLRDRGIALPLPGQSTTTVEDRLAQGLAVQKQIFGVAIDAMHAQAPSDQRHIQRFLSANCFGDYYTRTGLDLAQRELLTFAMLAAMGGCEPQLAGHVAGNLAVGNDRHALVRALTQLLPYIGYPRTLNALRVVNEGTRAPG